MPLAVFPIVVVAWVCFFFSSRRRHTRCLSDWSSDVCSSDLMQLETGRMTEAQFDDEEKLLLDRLDAVNSRLDGEEEPEDTEEPDTVESEDDTANPRSEERRVGKEGRGRWA